MALGKLPTSLLDDLGNIEYIGCEVVFDSLPLSDTLDYQRGVDKVSELVRMYGVCREILLTPEEILLVIKFLELHKRLSNKHSEVSNEVFRQ